MIRFRRKKQQTAPEFTRGTALFEWASEKDYLIWTIHPWERTQKLLQEIQKRTLADQVLLVSWTRGHKTCRILTLSPPDAKPVIAGSLLVYILRKAVDEKRILLWDDLMHDDVIRMKLKRTQFENVLVSPVLSDHDHADGLVIVNHSFIGGHSLVSDFIPFVSSVLGLALQNTRLYSRLRKTTRELKEWTSTVEQRIKEGTKQILEKEFQYHTLFEGASDGIVVHLDSGQFIEVNGAACQLLDYTKSDLLEQTWQDIAASESLSDLRQLFSNVMQKVKRQPLRATLRKRNGALIHAECTSRRIWFRGAEVVQTSLRDMTLQMALEESLRESKEKYQALVESALSGVFIASDGIIHFVNGQFETITGYSKQELLGQDLYSLLTSEDRGRVKRFETLRQNDDQAPEHYEARLVRKDGERCWCEIRCRRVVLGGKPVIVGNLIDITQRKEKELDLLESRKMDSIATLAGGVAHDFNNLLGGILGYASLLLIDMEPSHPFYSDIHAIAETTKRAADLTNRLLAFARGGKYSESSIQINHMLHDLIPMLSRTLPSDVLLGTNLGDSLWSICGDTKQVYQAILNICTNAIEAMPDGGDLTIETANETLDSHQVLTMTDLKPGEYVRITISDTGIGMNSETQSRLFEPFFSTKQTGQGVGLGLAVVYGVVKNHNGTVRVESALGEGTRVSVYLPRFVEKKAKRPSKPPRETVDRHGFVMLVDDEEVIRQVGRRMLEKGGLSVLLAANGKEAIDLYMKNKDQVDLVILDLIMPEMGGKETYRRLMEIDTTTKVLFASGYGPHDRPDLVRVESQHFIQKPFQTETLIQTVRDLLGISANN